MNSPALLPSIDALKNQAKRLRAKLEGNGNSIGHSQSLELLAHQHGFKDWNTLHATIGNRPPAAPVFLGERVRGHYLGRYFEGDVIGVQTLVHSDRFRVTIVFDDPVDVVTFEGMSNFRKRVSCTLGSDGSTTEKTSDGRPHLTLQK